MIRARVRVEFRRIMGGVKPTHVHDFSRMRIAFICQSYPPMVSGAALVVWRLAEGMAARHHDVLVLAASDRGRPYAQESEDGWLRVARLSAWPNPLRVGQHFLLWPERSI